jgi:hypothetical protein
MFGCSAARAAPPIVSSASARCIDLFHLARPQHHDAVGHRHRFDLIMGDVDHRRRQPSMQR